MEKKESVDKGHTNGLASWFVAHGSRVAQPWPKQLNAWPIAFILIMFFSQIC